MSDTTPKVPYASFEEWQLFYESTEKVTDRRLEANRWSYSICIGTLGAIAVVVAWVVSKPVFLWPGVLAVTILSLMAALNSSFWIAQIRDFKELNNAKFTVLNAMAEHVVFDALGEFKRSSFCPFAKEWKELKNARATREVAGMNLIALNSSNIEYLLPRALRVLFLAIAIAVPLLAWKANGDLKSDVPKLEVTLKGESASEL